MSGQKQVSICRNSQQKIRLNIPLSCPLFPPIMENVAKDNQLWLKSLKEESKAGVNECFSDFPAVLKDVLLVCNSFGHDQSHNYRHRVNTWTRQRRAEEALGSASGSFCFTVLKLGLLFLHISSSVFLVFIETHFSLSLALLPVVIKEWPARQ